MTPFHMPDNKVVKITAKTALRDRKTEAAIVSLLGIFAVLLLSILSSVFSVSSDKAFTVITVVFSILFSVFAVAPLFLGIVRYFWRMTDGAKDGLSSVFFYFGSKKGYIRALKLIFVVGWRVLTAAVVCMLPYAVVSAISGSELYRILGYEVPLWVPNFALIRSFLYILGISAAILYVARYYLAPILVVMDEDMLLLEAVHISSMVSKKSVGSFISLLLSLIVWIVLTALLIPAVYTLPFVLACYVIHCRFAIINYNLLIDNYENSMLGYYDEKE